MIFDLHNDFATALSPDKYKKYYNDVHGNSVVAAIWTSDMRDDATARVCEIRRNLLRARGGMITRTAIEDIGFTAERDLYKKFDFGEFMYCSLTWNYDNAFAGGALDGGGLTDKGKNAIEYIQNAGCLIDLAHLNRKSFFGVIDRVERGVLCSHTGFNEHPRCLDDVMIREITARKGVIGLCLVRAFNDAETPEQFIAVIDRYVQKHGIDSLAIGTDYYGSTDLTEGLHEYSRLEGIRYGLTTLGYTDADVDKIFCGNAQNLLG